MKNKSSLLLLVAAVGTLILAGCGGNKNQQVISTEENEDVKVWLNEDSTVYGLCGDGSAMNTLQLITDTGSVRRLLSSSMKVHCLATG